jgi:hypothetical protein
MDAWHRCHGKWIIMKVPRVGYFYRGIADLSRCVWEKLGSRKGIQHVMLIRLKKKNRSGQGIFFVIE